MLPDLLRFVLVRTSHPGNIGSAARAMRTMGFSRMELVAPARFPHAEASALAAGADDNCIYGADAAGKFINTINDLERGFLVRNGKIDAAKAAFGQGAQLTGQSIRSFRKFRIAAGDAVTMLPVAALRLLAGLQV